MGPSKSSNLGQIIEYIPGTSTFCPNSGDPQFPRLACTHYLSSLHSYSHILNNIPSDDNEGVSCSQRCQ